MAGLPLLLLLALAPCVAQYAPDPNLAPIRTPYPTPSPEQAMIKTEDGTPFGVSPQIIPLPGSGCSILAVFGSGRVEFRPVYERAAVVSAAHQAPCRVMIAAAGYRATRAALRNGLVIVLNRLGANEGSTVSFKDLRAPAESRKEYERGEQALVQKKWTQAEQHFEQAVALYPEFATAWSELGAARQHQAKAGEAEQALKRAIELDPRYLKPYAQLAGLLGDQKRWGDSAAVAERALQLKPVEFPQIYCEYARASLQLGNLEAAEKSAREAIEIDASGTVAQAEYFLGEVLEAKGNRMGARYQMKRYLQRDKHGAYAEAAKKRLAEWK